MAPRISVVLPVYNAEDTLDAAVESIMQQTEKNFQLVIVDDGSTDASVAGIQRWARRDQRIEPVFREHRGIVAALNSGLRQAKGRYIARMDADDICLPQRLEKQADFLDRHSDVGLVSCLVQHLGNKNEQRGYARYVQWINSLTTPEEISVNRFIESPLAHPSVMFRSWLIDQYGRYRDGNFPEDYELWLRWLKEEVAMQKVTEVLLQWRDRAGRLSRNSERYSGKAFYRIKAKYLSDWLTENNPQHPNVVIWGAGRKSRKRAEFLTKHGVTITHYIDINSNKIGQKIHGRLVWSPEDIPKNGQHFIISYVGNRGANKNIEACLEKIGYKPAEDYIFAS